MEQKLFKLAAGNRIRRALFVTLFLYPIYDSRTGEKTIQKDGSYIKSELKRRLI